MIGNGVNGSNAIVDKGAEGSVGFDGKVIAGGAASTGPLGNRVEQATVNGLNGVYGTTGGGPLHLPIPQQPRATQADLRCVVSLALYSFFPMLLIVFLHNRS